MDIRLLKDKNTIERFLRGNIPLHLYSIGDLDDFFWPYTRWYGYLEGARIESIALVYAGQPQPTLLALAENPTVTAIMLKDLLNHLPPRFYAHLSPGLAPVFRSTHNMEPYGAHLKMSLADRKHIDKVDTSSVIRLTDKHLDHIVELYEISYPGNWFDKRMLDTGCYFGLFNGGELVSVAGIHVYSKTYGVAALGNITTHPAWRRRGYGIRVTARLCQALSETVTHIGLNVRADNEAAISCYKKLGFEVAATYEEWAMERL